MASKERVIINRLKAALGDDWALKIIADLHIKRATVYAWDANESIPKVLDLIKIAKFLNTTVEELVDGEAGEQYLREYIQEKGWEFSPPPRIADIVKALGGLSDDELVPIWGAIKAILDKKGASGVTPEIKSEGKAG
jgi:transcriptional regulator with XRE-family HTH domain